MDKKLRVLIVEDSVADAELVIKELSQEGLVHTSKLIKSKDEFLQALEEYRPDIILCDYKMPGFGAPEALEIAKKVSSETPFVVVSGAIGEDIAVEMVKSGAIDYVMKDKLFRLAPAVKRALKEKEERAERKKAEEGLRLSEQTFSEILNNIDGLVYVVDMKTYETLFINRYGKKIWGDFTGKICWQNLQVGQKSPCSFCTNDRLLHSDGTFAGVYVWEFQNTVTSQWFECRDSAIFWPDGRTVRMEIAIDITERKKLEEEARKYVEELKAAYLKLKEVQAQVVQSAKLASIGQLAAGVAHEINNPLTGVINNVQLIKMEAENKKCFNLEEFRQLLDAVEESGQRCKRIAQSLLDFSHASTGISKLLSLNEVAEKVITLVEHELKLQDIFIQKNFQPDLPLISGDPQLLQQVIFNFISNAKWAIQKKSTKEGGIIIIKTQYDAGKKEADIFISDSGVGISEENLKKVFGTFFSTKEVGEGTGLGLSLAQDIVHKHGGRIKVESRLGEGAVFKVSFPVISEAK